MDDGGFRYWDEEKILEVLHNTPTGVVRVGGPRTIANVQQLVERELVEILPTGDWGGLGQTVRAKLTDFGKLVVALRRST